MVNLQIRQFRDSLISATNASSLPIEIKRLIFAEVQANISQKADEIILAERQEENNKNLDEREENQNE